jgi:hypothetical protein
MCVGLNRGNRYQGRMRRMSREKKQRIKESRVKIKEGKRAD